MKFKLDENISPQTAKVFTDHGFDAHSVRDEKLTGCDDDHLIYVCTVEQRILVTLDLDFSDIRKYPPSAYMGIIVLRTEKQSRNHIISILERVIPILKRENIKGKLMIIEENKIRLR